MNRTNASVGDANLVVSPTNARAKLTTLLAGAHASLQIKDEEMYNSASEDAMIAAAKRGVNVQVVLPAPSSSSGGSSDVARLLAGGVPVRYLRAPYVHAKLIVADGTLAYVGSENFSATSLDESREVGLLIADSSALGTLTHTFTLDRSAAADAQ
jgi:phosphatidylserine/phosphatidylglycerophosphate/cardiolipin synthase-like enzyme